jgi:hypothetical protein
MAGGSDFYYPGTFVRLTALAEREDARLGAALEEI